MPTLHPPVMMIVELPCGCQISVAARSGTEATDLALMRHQDDCPDCPTPASVKLDMFALKVGFGQPQHVLQKGDPLFVFQN